MRKFWLAVLVVVVCTPVHGQRGYQSLRHMEDHFDYWDRCTDNRYELERRIAYCKSILGDGRHSELAVLMEIGNAYFEARKYDEAVTSYLEALKHHDWYLGMSANNALEEALLLSGHFDAALEHVNARVKQSPNSASLYSQRCWLRAVAGKDLDSALADCNEALKLDPRSADALDSHGMVNFRLNKLTEAEADFDAALDGDSDLVGARYVRGIIKLRNGNADAGNDDIAAAKKRDPAVAERFADYGVKP